MYENPGSWLPSMLQSQLPIAEMDRFQWHYPSTCGVFGRSSSPFVPDWQNQPVVFLGDSVVRFLYHAYITKVFDPKHGVPPGAAHSDMQHSNEAKFIWAPFIDNLTTSLNQTLAMNMHTRTLEKKPLIVLGSGPWDALQKHDFSAFQSAVLELAKIIQSNREYFYFIWVEFGTLQDSKMLSREKREFLIESKAVGYRLASEPLYRVCNAVLPMRVMQRGRETRDGVHYDPSTYFAATSVLLRLGVHCPEF